jgi:hypothetical protein
VVNTGCDIAGCGTTIAYRSGWPVPIDPTGSASGPGTCPNGIISSSPLIYCYRSLEAADVDHALPPFVQLSKAGWDLDQDGIVNADDKCSSQANAGSLNCDTDQDGYGNVCDGDFEQNNLTTASDFSTMFLPDFNKRTDSGVGTDMDCSGLVTSADSTLFTTNFGKGKPGPSGLTCAGTVPCDL